MTNNLTRPLIGKWRITEADLWDRRYLDLVEPAYIRFEDNGHGDPLLAASTAISTVGIPVATFSLHGGGSMKWTKFQVTDRQNSTKTERARSKSALVAEMKPI